LLASNNSRRKRTKSSVICWTLALYVLILLHNYWQLNIQALNQINQSYSLKRQFFHACTVWTTTLPPRIPANRPHPTHTAPPPTIIHALNNDRKKHRPAQHTSGETTDRDTRRERRRPCFIARVFYGRMPFLPPTNPNDVSSGRSRRTAGSSFIIFMS